jgi:hypothetical protein
MTATSDAFCLVGNKMEAQPHKKVVNAAAWNRQALRLEKRPHLPCRRDTGSPSFCDSSGFCWIF